MENWHIEHSAKGSTWKKHKYVKKMNVGGRDRYFYDMAGKSLVVKTSPMGDHVKKKTIETKPNSRGKKAQVFNTSGTKKKKNTRILDQIFSGKTNVRNTTLWTNVKLKSIEAKEARVDGMAALTKVMHMKKK